LRHWKSDTRLNKAPFIVYTATYTEPEDERLARSLGADAFILKTTEPEQFLSRLLAVQACMETATARPSEPPASTGDGLLREYSEALVRKLEQKTHQLEESNGALQADIAARELAEAALRESEANFRLLTEVMPQLVWIASADGANRFCNQRWLEYTGLTLVESAGDGWTKAVHSEDRSAADLAWKESTRTGCTFSLEFRLRKLDGSYRWWLVRALPVRAATGEIIKWFGTCTDIDDLKQAAVKLQRTEEQLRQAQKMEAVGQLAAGVAHDFNNILSVVLGYASFILDGLEPDSPLRADVEEIRTAGERAAVLTLRLLTFSRQQVLKPRQVDLREILRGLDNMLRRLIGADINLSLLSEESSGHVFVDPGQVEQLIMNLVVNARDAMPTGGNLTIELASATLDAAYAAEHRGVTPGQYATLAVSDTGYGMDEETQSRIFEPFFTTKQKVGGTGLGLAIVYGIATQSGGHVCVQSELGAGTTFKVYLPCAEGPPEPEEAAGARDLTLLRGDETILLVEDSDPVRAVMCSLLRRAGYTVLEAPNGGEALLICEQYKAKIQLLLTDVILPRISGRELAERVSRARPEVRVLYTSGYTKEAIVHHGMLGAGIAFLPKPITPRALLLETRRVLDAELPRKRRAPGASAAPPQLAAAGGKRILHVDDEDSLVQLTARILERLGYQVSGFTDPGDALRAFLAQPDAFHAVVTDITMPGMNGFELVRQLRRRRADVPIVVTAGYFRAEDIREAESLGLRALLVKPDTVEELGRILHDEIVRSSGTAPIRSE
ncbi:MAG: hypothetical protein RL685_5049, partial [Pseudomonadota bacterium]